jgi:DNA phosphorothioation system restriction enzyme
MSKLVDLDLRNHYRSSSHLLGRDFLGHVLPHSIRYQRAAAFFSSSIFNVARDEFAVFFASGHRLEVVCSPRLQHPDVLALSRAIYERPSVTSQLKRSVAEVFSHGDPSTILCELLVRGLLEMRIAVREPAYDLALYHEKLGVFRDGANSVLAFAGSANESYSAWVDNFERIDVFASWAAREERQRARTIELQFQQLWKNETPGVHVYSLIEALRSSLIEAVDSEGSTRRADSAQHSPSPRGSPEALVPPGDLTLFDHQRMAIREWGVAGGAGILHMATGSGKTLTALMLASKLYDKMGPGLAIAVVAPYIHLVDQWIGVAKRFGLHPVRCAESWTSWYEELAAAIHALNAGKRPVLSLATTSSTLIGEPLQRLLRRIRKPFLFIGDEAHNYGSQRVFPSLPENATFRLGLSATPDRWMDEEGTEQLRTYFGEIVYRYDLRDAIKDEVLTPYRYHPVLVDLQADELDEYLELSRLLGRYLQGDKDGPIGQVALRLLLKRARLLASARAKLPKLKELLEPRRKESHILVYCGDGQIEGAESTETIRQIEEVTRMIGRDLGMTCAKYVAETLPERRQELLKMFAAGDLQVLVAIRCLDEGVDVPATRTAFLLASSTNPRQFVQRRGRVLRRDLGKRRAEIYDFFVSPPLAIIDKASEEFKVIRRLFGNQIRRASEFADLAENSALAREALLEISSALNLVSEWGVQDG